MQMQMPANMRNQKHSTILKVTSILMIIFNLFSLGLTLLMIPARNLLLSDPEASGLDSETLAALPSNFIIGFSALGCLIGVIAGVAGAAHRKWTVCLILMLAYIVLQLISVIISIPTSGISLSMFLSFIIPALYLWGVKEIKQQQ